MRKVAQGRAESGIEVELVDQLEQAHQCDDEGKVGRIETDPTGFVWSTVSLSYRLALT